MILIEVASLVFSYDLISSFSSRLKLYEVKDKNPDFFIKNGKFPYKKEDLKEILTSKFYNLYKTRDEKIVQLVKNDSGKVLGIISYDGNVATLTYNQNYDDSTLSYIEYTLSEYAFVYFLLRNKEALFVHSSSFIYKGLGVLLIASSGTGKSTHRKLREQYEGIKVINDDKNVLVYENDHFVIYPNPYSGKEIVESNENAPLKALVFLQRGNDEVKKIKEIEVVKNLLPHTINPSFIIDNEKWKNLYFKLVKTDAFLLKASMKQDAVNCLKEKLDEIK